MIKYFFIAVLLTGVLLLNSELCVAQLGLAVSKNDNGSSVKYALTTGKTLKEAELNAQKELEAENLKNIFILSSEEKTGHELNSGIYVLIQCSRKGISGRFFISYGLGCSKISKEEAEKRALIHLKENDWGYEDDMGYAIEKEGKIEDLFPKEE